MKRILIFYFLLFCSFFASCAPKGDNFQLSPSDLKSLGVSEAEAQEFQQFINALNNMSPEEQEMFQKLGQELENQMKTNGLDPNNSDDVLKWIESQQGGAPLGVPTKADTKAKEPKISKQPEITPTTPTVRSDITIDDARKLIIEIIQKLSAVRQKMSIYGNTDNIQLQKETNELTYLLNVMTKESLLQHLITKDFTPLYTNLEKLRSGLVTYEPQLTIDTYIDIDEDDPYELLGVSYGASEDEIELAFDLLKSQKSPEAVEAILDQNNIEGKERKNILTDARLSFSFINAAYEALKDPQERAIIDKLLKDKISKSRANAQKINSTINRLNNIIVTAITVHDISGEIKKLLKKHEPQQLEAAKRQAEKEQKAFERSKAAKAAAPQMKHLPSSESQYDAFWQSVAQEKHAKDYAQYRPSSYGDSFRSAPSSHGASATAAADKASKEASKDGAKKEDRKDEKGKDKDKEKDTKSDGKASGAAKEGAKAEPKKLDEKDQTDILSSLISLEKLLEKTKDEIEVPIPSLDGLIGGAAKRKKAISDQFAPGDIKQNLDQEQSDGADDSDAQPKMEKIAINTIMKDLENYMASPQTKSGMPNESIIFFKQLSKDNKVAEIKKELEELKKKVKTKIEDQSLKKRWHDKIFDKYGYRIEKIWGNQIGMVLDPLLRNANNLPNLNAAKYGIHLDKKNQKNAQNISSEFEAMKDSAKLFREISTQFGIPATQAPKAPDKKK